jgi:hypothetical protein
MLLYVNIRFSNVHNCNITMHYIATKLVISKIQLDISMSSCVLLIILLLNINIWMAKEYLRQQKVFTNCRQVGKTLFCEVFNKIYLGHTSEGRSQHQQGHKYIIKRNCVSS